MLRASSYIIYVDLPDGSDDMLLVHGYNGTYDKVSRRVATYVRSLEARKAPRPLFGTWSPEPAVDGQVAAPSDATVTTLRRRGYLTEMSLGQEEEFFEKFVGKIHERNVRQMPNYIFMPTYDCNLRCGYCFQDHMRTDPQFRHLLTTMSPEMIDRLFTGMPQIEALHGITGNEPRQRRIGFFGGEPLLASNRPAVEHIIRKAEETGGGSFWAVSNATELDAYADLLTPNKIGSVQITLDGPPSEHDQRRVYADGSGSFERIASNVSMALERGVLVSIRMNIDRNNIQHLPALAQVIHDRGWDQYPHFGAYTAPIRPTPHATGVARGSTMNSWELDQGLDAIRAQYPLTAMIGAPDDSLHGQARRLFDTPGQGRPAPQESFCGAHSRMYIFDPFGDIYTCWERTGDPSIRIGTVGADGGVTIDQQVLDLWRTRTVASNPVCKKCRYALNCGGGCAVLALGASGKYHMNYCDGFGARFRAKVAEAYLDHTSGKPVDARNGRVCDM